MADHHDDELAATTTEGFKVGEKKTLDEYNQLGMSIQSQFIGNI
jgi:Rho GDP-dissociation inhibitor